MECQARDAILRTRGMRFRDHAVVGDQGGGKGGGEAGGGLLGETVESSRCEAVRTREHADIRRGSAG